MPYIGSSGARFHLDGPSGQLPSAAAASSGQRTAYLAVGAALLLSLVALVRLGRAASAAIESINAATPAAALAPTHARLGSLNASFAGG